ncbi:ABC transporter permease [Streptomyces sp. C10-9-1]|uniref:ABC transporter permease n=1 Tax=Streptomyces sp. C10-9-1 TaxID=1859285 RepID=UPI003F4A839E
MTPAAGATAGCARESLVGELKARFRDLTAAEWIKIRSLRSTAWGLLLAGSAVVALTTGAAWHRVRYWAHPGDVHPSLVAEEISLLDAFTSHAAMVLTLASAVFGAVAVTGEYGSGLIRTTFTAVPARSAVVAAKAVVVAAVTALFGAVCALASFAATQAVLRTMCEGIPPDHPSVLRLLTASALLAPVAALAGLALGTLLRHGAATAVACVAVLLLLPVVVSDDRHPTALLAHALPFEAWSRLALVESMVPDGAIAYPWSTAGAWTVYVVWSVVSVAVAATVVHHRDQ